MSEKVTTNEKAEKVSATPAVEQPVTATSEETTAACCQAEEEVLTPCEKSAKAQNIVQNSMYCALGLGLVPIPIFDFAAITLLQLEMLRRLSKVYGIGFCAHTGKNLLGSLLGGGFSATLSPLVASSIKIIPVVGSTLGAVSMPVIAGATTYAVGKVFVQHLESGGTFLTFDPKAVKEYYAEQFKEGVELATAARTKAA